MGASILHLRRDKSAKPTVITGLLPSSVRGATVAWPKVTVRRGL